MHRRKKRPKFLPRDTLKTLQLGAAFLADGPAKDGTDTTADSVQISRCKRQLPPPEKPVNRYRFPTDVVGAAL
jgi:hypothetical protein